MRKFFKRIISFFLVPLTRWYLRKERQYSYLGVTIKVFSGVFHPGLFYSTTFLINFLLAQKIRNKSLLELGCGTGLLSIISAKNGAVVTASDLSHQAIKNITSNAVQNQAKITIIYSDLFDRIEQKPFDWIIINPPYYKKDPLLLQDYAWYCGENGEYFSALFNNLSDYIHRDTKILMILNEDCDIEMITGFAAKNGFVLNCVYSKKNLLEKNFIFKIEKIK